MQKEEESINNYNIETLICALRDCKLELSWVEKGLRINDLCSNDDDDANEIECN